ncbi:MAG: hypothetical protein AVDCRST_MAG76-1180 [uncultured Acidimicrobiales bacterium]|uniref:Uncharacterized protein n=1 Tax=uncultured Acidimicrobiales bacterium TaxID=310071 RepID=A0A6J4HPC6_9ACTN|nr:MAG: hypothetical protein AVDCRST_MAG76-1180 [uncultured Acidimicrobiales bacterium]
MDPLEQELAHWLAEARVDEAVTSRLRERAMRQLAGDEATLLGLCLDLAETGRAVLARTAESRVHRGALVAVGADFVALRSPSGEATFLPVGHLAWLRPAPGSWSGGVARAGEAAGSRVPPVAARLVDILTGLAADRPRVRLVVAGDPDTWAGRLRACGADVLSVEQAGDPPVIGWIPLSQVTEVGLVDER